MDADISGPVYAAIFLVITSSLGAFAVGSYVVWRVVFSVPPDKRPVFGYLLLSLSLIAVAQMTDHIRIAIVRMIRDNYLPQAWMATVYDDPLITSLPKVLMAMALAFSAVLKLSLFWNLSNKASLAYAAFAAADVLLIWTIASLFFVVVM